MCSTGILIVYVLIALAVGYTAGVITMTVLHRAARRR